MKSIVVTRKSWVEEFDHMNPYIPIGVGVESLEDFVARIDKAAKGKDVINVSYINEMEAVISIREDDFYDIVKDLQEKQKANNIKHQKHLEKLAEKKAKEKEIELNKLLEGY